MSGQTHYALSKWFPYEGSEVTATFDSVETAKAFAQSKSKSPLNWQETHNKTHVADLPPGGGDWWEVKLIEHEPEVAA